MRLFFVRFWNRIKYCMHQWVFTRWQKKCRNIRVFCKWCRFCHQVRGRFRFHFLGSNIVKKKIFLEIFLLHEIFNSFHIYFIFDNAILNNVYNTVCYITLLHNILYNIHFFFLLCVCVCVCVKRSFLYIWNL